MKQLKYLKYLKYFLFFLVFMFPCVVDAAHLSLQFSIPSTTIYYSERIEHNIFRYHRSRHQMINQMINQRMSQRVHRQEGRIYYVDDRFNQVIVVPSRRMNNYGCGCCGCCGRCNHR